MKLRDEIRCAGLSGQTIVGVDYRLGRMAIERISVEQLLNGRYKTLLDSNVYRVINTENTSCNDVKYIFILNRR